MRPWFVYILRCGDATLYTGITNDLQRRLEEHNKGSGAKYTRGRGRGRFIYTKECESRSAALKEEARLKDLTRKEKLSLAKNFKGKARELPSKLFKVVNEGFACGNCGAEVLPTTCGSPRNHCPFCLCSKHVDIHVGDRANPCKGLMKPVSVVTAGRKNYVLVQKCLKCGEVMRSKVIPYKDVQPDDFDLIVELSTKPLRSA